LHVHFQVKCSVIALFLFKEGDLMNYTATLSSQGDFKIWRRD